MPFPQRQKTYIRVCVFTALLLIYIDIYQTIIYKYIHTKRVHHVCIRDVSYVYVYVGYITHVW